MPVRVPHLRLLPQVPLQRRRIQRHAGRYAQRHAVSTVRAADGCDARAVFQDATVGEELVGEELVEDLVEAEPAGVRTRGTRIREHELLERVPVEVVVEVHDAGASPPRVLGLGPSRPRRLSVRVVRTSEKLPRVVLEDLVQDPLELRPSAPGVAGVMRVPALAFLLGVAPRAVFVLDPRLASRRGFLAIVLLVLVVIQHRLVPVDGPPPPSAPA